MRISLLTIAFIISILGYSQDTIRFTQGLVISNNATFLRSAFKKDTLAHGILMDKIARPKEGGIPLKGYQDTWETLEVDQEGLFISRRKLRAGYLYLTYNSKKDTKAILQTTGNTAVFFNGIPREGDHYNFGYSMIPVDIKKGLNEIYLTGGRFGRVKAEIIIPKKNVFLTDKDLTLPHLIRGEDKTYWGAIRVVNNTDKHLKNLSIVCTMEGKSITTDIGSVSPMNVRKLGFKIPYIDTEVEDVHPEIALLLNGKKVDEIDIILEVKNSSQHHSRTFISKIDNSIQYFSVAPTSDPSNEKPAMFLSVHGASVEAINQARAYKPKEWGYVVAPTNRRPYGFAWEDWGRKDALEVLAEGERLFKTDPKRTYLTGHSMGGHGTWHLGVTYPNKWAAIAPCAGYPDLRRYYWIGEDIDESMTDTEKIFSRAGNPQRTLKLSRNFLHYGVYIYHGGADTVVPTDQARRMRQHLSTFHTDFSYYEYPNQPHWFKYSVDWKPLFDFLSYHTIPELNEIDKFEFYTASPSVSSETRFIKIIQQEKPYEISSISVEQSIKEKNIKISTENIRILSVDLNHWEMDSLTLIIDSLSVFTKTDIPESILFKKENEKWSIVDDFSKQEKYFARNGNFKEAFDNNMLFVYGTQGSSEENEWNYVKARFDSETFYYRGNGSVEIIPDTEFNKETHADRGVVIYGNKTTNSAWSVLLKDSPIIVENGLISYNNTTLNGAGFACYFTVPNPYNETTSVSVISATGLKGIKAGYDNRYFLAGAAFPDFCIFDEKGLTHEYEGVIAAGFFDNNWKITEE